MSKESVIKLFDYAENNLELRQQLYNTKTASEVLSIAKKSGLEFTESELLEVMQEKQLSFVSNEELLEEQLESVVGGKNNKTTNNYYK